MDNDLSLAAIDRKVERYRSKLITELETTRKTRKDHKDHKELRALVESVFANYGEVIISLPSLVSLCVQKQGATPETWTSKARELEDFIRSHAHQEEWIQIRRGKGVALITTHIFQGMMGATCKSVIVSRTHSRKKRATKRKSKR